MEKFNSKAFPKTLFFDFSNPNQKHKRLFTLNPKTYFSCSKNTREIENFSPKILRENLSQMEYLQAIQKTSRLQNFCQKQPSGRPARSTVQRSIFDRWQLTVDRPGRPKNPESRIVCSGRPSRSTADCARNVHRFVHVLGRPSRSTGYMRSTVTVDRTSLAGSKQVRKLR